LRGLGRRESSEVGFAAKCRGVATRDDRSFSRRYHCRSQSSREIQQRHRIDLEVPIEHVRINLHEIAKRAAHSIVDQDLRRA